MTARELFDRLSNLPDVQLTVDYAFPYVQIILTSPAFSEARSEDKEALVASWVGLTISEFRHLSNNALITFHLVGQGEAEWVPKAGTHWIYGALTPAIEPTNLAPPTVIHFFGYKGGQARSSVLAILARFLADSGLRVLLIDADLEAPSLPAIVGKQPRLAASTLLGLFQNEATVPVPLPCVSTTANGKVDLIPARLPETTFDWDYDAFTIKALIDPKVTARLGKTILTAARSQYDVIFVDQRTGSSPATLNWFTALPGGYCLFARLDNQWQAGKRFYSVLARRSASFGAAIVSFKPDEENPDSYRSRNANQISELSRIVEESFLEKLPLQGEDDPAEGIADLDRWVMWPYDQAYRLASFPSIKELGLASRSALQQLRDLLNLPSPPIPASHTPLRPQRVQGHHSGLLDAGLLIHTEVLRDLLQANSSVNYIFGRKGTGKSRLFAAMAERKVGIPLVADDNFEGELGLRSHEIREYMTLDRPQNEFSLWWNILEAAVQGGVKRTALRKSLRYSTESNSESFRRAVATSGSRNVFLIDGLETAFGPLEIEKYVKALFEVMRVIQADSEIREHAEIKLFLRTDLKQRAGIQNLEQQIYSRDRYLSWDLQSILNFFLSRVASEASPLFKKLYPEQIENIKVRSEEIQEAAVTSEDAFELLLPMFPERVRRVNAKMQTFITLHFADSSSEGGNYYPRFVQGFLDHINQAGQSAASNTRFRGEVRGEDGRLTSAIVQYAYDEAAKQFLSEVRQELEFVLHLEPTKIDPLLQAFAGEVTPFEVASLVKTISQRLSLPEEEIQEALNSLKELGIFELRPGYENSEWRAGRIFRSALKMKLRR
jgi:hypothetical protein